MADGARGIGSEADAFGLALVERVAALERLVELRVHPSDGGAR